jgi:hypothetical protein
VLTVHHHHILGFDGAVTSPPACLACVNAKPRAYSDATQLLLMIDTNALLFWLLMGLFGASY